MKHICCIILCFCTSIGSYAQNFADYFQNKTLRVDYIFTGDATQQAIYLDELSQLPTCSRAPTSSLRTSLGRQRANYCERPRQQTVYLQNFFLFFISRMAVNRRS